MTAVLATYCPHCRVITNLRAAVAPSIVTEPDGKEKIVASRAYQCESCGLFVRSEEDESSALG